MLSWWHPTSFYNQNPWNMSAPYVKNILFTLGKFIFFECYGNHLLCSLVRIFSDFVKNVFYNFFLQKLIGIVNLKYQTYFWNVFLIITWNWQFKISNLLLVCVSDYYTTNSSKLSSKSDWKIIPPFFMQISTGSVTESAKKALEQKNIQSSLSQVFTCHWHFLKRNPNKYQ